MKNFGILSVRLVVARADGKKHITKANPRGAEFSFFGDIGVMVTVPHWPVAKRHKLIPWSNIERVYVEPAKGK